MDVKRRKPSSLSPSRDSSPFQSNSPSTAPSSTPSLRSQPSPSSSPSDLSFPITTLLFLLFSISAFASAYFNVAFDCDEIYNYWEPTHYLMYGFGFQTWEYSPVYGLRSYLYVWLHAQVGQFFRLVFPYKFQIFFAIKVSLGLISALCQTYFVSAVFRRFGSNVCWYTAFFLLFSPGMLISSTSLLPSSFAMYCLLIAFGGWFSGNYFLATFSAACAVLVGWPFVLLLIFPMAMDTLVQCRTKTFLWSFVSLVFFVAPTIAVDWYYYGKIFFAPVNIVLYNFLQQSEGGSSLYGTEPPSYYYMNCFLNFNIVFFLALPVLPIAMLFRRWTGSLLQRVRGKDLALYISPMYLWFAFMTYFLEHKEERFLFVIYPLFCLAASLSVVILLSVLGAISSALSRRYEKANIPSLVLKIATSLFCFLFITLSLSRCAAMYRNYRAPYDVYGYLERVELRDRSSIRESNSASNVCVGKEWYRFTSHFFIPDESTRIEFLKSGFAGQLPRHYEKINGTSIIPPHMNSFNREEPSRYVSLNSCLYLIEFLEDPDDLPSDEWEMIYSSPFLSVSKSPSSFFRAFWIPFLSDRRNIFSHYALFKKKNQKGVE
jgi:alpha-1,2-mannosyltransferase